MADKYEILSITPTNDFRAAWRVNKEEVVSEPIQALAVARVTWEKNGCSSNEIVGVFFASGSWEIIEDDAYGYEGLYHKDDPECPPLHHPEVTTHA